MLKIASGSFFRALGYGITIVSGHSDTSQLIVKKWRLGEAGLRSKRFE